MLGVVDRFEGEYAVIEMDDGRIININKGSLPSNIKEGDVLRETECGLVMDAQETAKRKRCIEELTSDMWSE